MSDGNDKTNPIFDRPITGPCPNCKGIATPYVHCYTCNGRGVLPGWTERELQYFYRLEEKRKHERMMRESKSYRRRHRRTI